MRTYAQSNLSAAVTSEKTVGSFSFNSADLTVGKASLYTFVIEYSLLKVYENAQIVIDTTNIDVSAATVTPPAVKFSATSNQFVMTLTQPFSSYPGKSVTIILVNAVNHVLWSNVSTAWRTAT